MVCYHGKGLNSHVLEIPGLGSHVDFTSSLSSFFWSFCKAWYILFSLKRSMLFITNSSCMLWYFNFNWIGDTIASNISVKGLPMVQLQMLLHEMTKNWESLILVSCHFPREDISFMYPKRHVNISLNSCKLNPLYRYTFSFLIPSSWRVLRRWYHRRCHHRLKPWKHKSWRY